MTVEELDIIVTASIEPALKEIKKLMPQIKQQVTQAVEVAQKSMEQIDTKKVSNKIQQAFQLVRKKIDNIVKSNKNNEISIKVNNEEASKQISQLEKEIDSLQKKINARQIKLDAINPRIDSMVNQTRESVVPEGISFNDKSMDSVVNNALSSNKDFTTLNNQAQKLYTEIEMYNSQLSEAKNRMSQLKQETEKTSATQGKLSSFFSAFKSKIEQVKPSIGGIKTQFKQMPILTQNITNNIKGMGTGIKQGLGHILKYAGALFSLRSIYSMLSNSARAWLSSQNVGAQQLSANIEYMKYAMGSAFAPVIQYVTGLVYQLMKALQSVIYAFSGINIFAKATASSMKSASGSANKASKSLAGVHNEINNVSEQNGGGSSGGGATPSMDLSQIDKEMSPFARKLYDFFAPLKESWDKYSPQVISAFHNAINGIGASISAMWNSVETIFTNGTIYSIIANILNSIGAIGQAWANAWNNDNNGTEIIQGIANIIDDITQAILNLVSSTGFQSFLNGILSAISGIVQFLEPVIRGFSKMAEVILEIVLSTIGDILQKIGDTLQAIGQNKTAVKILEAIGKAIGIVVAGVIAWNVAQVILNGLMGLFAILTSSITLIILGIIAAITAIILIIENWGAISEWFGNLWKTITDKIKQVWESIKQFFINLWNSIINKIKEVWNGIKDFLSNLWNGVKNIATTVFNAISNTISSIFNGIKNTASNIWNNIKNNIVNAVNNIKNGIANAFQTAYNKVTSIFRNIGNFFSGIWNIVRNSFSSLGTTIGNAISNSVKSGINGVISLIERTINTAIRLINGGIRLINLIPGVSVGTIRTLNLPRLAKGGVIDSPTVAMMGEYSGASNNPEIVTPQNIMYDTIKKALNETSGFSNEQPIHLTVQYLGKDIFDDTIDYINSKTRRTGKCVIQTT